MNRRMTKTSLLLRLEQLQILTETEPIQAVYKDAILDSLLDYINDKSIREAVEKAVL